MVSIINSMGMNLQTQRDSEGQGSLACSSSWVCRVRQDLVTEPQQKYIEFIKKKKIGSYSTAQGTVLNYIPHHVIMEKKMKNKK